MSFVFIYLDCDYLFAFFVVVCERCVRCGNVGGLYFFCSVSGMAVMMYLFL